MDYLLNERMGYKMGIAYVRIENFKSIKSMYINISEINALIGVNGSGKSNIISAMRFFYDNLTKSTVNGNQDVYDINNHFSNEVRITVGYNLWQLKKRCYENLKKTEGKRYESFYRDVTRLNDYFEVTLIAVKNRVIAWNKSFSERKLIYNLFPIYIIDTRKINLVDWENLWLQIGDLGKLDEKTGKEFREKIKETLVGYTKTKEVYSRIEKLFGDNGIKISKYSPKQIAAVTARLYFSGDEFEFHENRLIYFSDGTNSFNFIRTFIQILAVLNEIKMKEPIVILDEPEISLHHNLIDGLSLILFNSCSSLSFILSTHSTRLIKNLLIGQSDRCHIYQVKFNNRYSILKKMRPFNDNRENVVITDQHANAFFSKMVVCVEGVTEIEVLRNRFLHLIYPILSQVDVMGGMADDVERKIVSPSERNYEMPILYTADMDKIFSFDVKTRKVVPENKIKLVDEKYAYTYRRSLNKKYRKRKDAMEKKCFFNFRMPLFYSNDPYYTEYKKLVKEYYLLYDYYIMDSTIEGALITINNIEEFRAYAEYEGNEEKRRNYGRSRRLERLHELERQIKKSTLQEVLMAYRILYNGKTDLLFQYKQIEANNPNINATGVEELYSVLKDPIASKTDGWVSRWLEYFICMLMNIVPYERDTYVKARRIMNSQRADEIRQNFKVKFPELNEWVEEMLKRVKGD